MEIKDIIELKEREKMSLEQVSDLSGIPLDVVEKIFTGEEQEVNYLTLLVLEQVIITKKKLPFFYNREEQVPRMLREQVAYRFDARKYYLNELEKLCECLRMELIDGKLYAHNTPNRMHQFIISQLLYEILKHIKSNNGKCHAYTTGLGVRLFNDESTWVIPDIMVVCKTEILNDKDCGGAPDWLIEVVSPSNAYHDYITKAAKYQEAGVREYWIIDPRLQKVTVYDFENSKEHMEYTYEEIVRSKVLAGFEIRIEDFIHDYEV